MINNDEAVDRFIEQHCPTEYELQPPMHCSEYKTCIDCWSQSLQMKYLSKV